MDLRYFNYLSSTNNSFYTKPDTPNRESALYISNIPNNYKTIKENHWIHIMNKDYELPMQGWKIHISTTIDSAEKTLEIVSNILFAYKVSFKYVKSLWELSIKNSKYSDRSSAGKFITIFPSNEEVFLNLLKILSRQLDTLPKGPYILTDKRWYDSNVYFRYGAFIGMYFYEDNKKVYAIQSPSGDLVEDSRRPHYSIPEFITEPAPIREMDTKLENEIAEPTRLDDIEIIHAIHYSNGGGVYLAVDKLNNKVILKEGRPNIGLDSLGIDAFTRIKNEAMILEKLEGTHYPVKIYDFFRAWEHHFIIEEYIEGTSLRTWLAIKYPFYTNEPNKEYQYLKSALNILNQLIDALTEIHNHGIGIGDLQPSNIIITPEENIRLIDFETASFINDSVPSGLKTFGFTGEPNLTRKQADWFALLRISRYLFLPIGPVQDISSKILEIHDRYIENYFGSEAIKIINKIQDICSRVQAKSARDLLNYEYKYKHIKEMTLNEMKISLQNNIIKNLFVDERVIPGDIRQYELKNGLFNILTGGFGVVLAFNRANIQNEQLHEWICHQSLDDLLKMEDGLLTGKAGIATTLWESGYYDKAKLIFNSINNFKDNYDVTLSSGLSGIGLAFLGLSYEKDSINYLNKSIEIANRLEELLEKNVSIVPYDIDIIPRGLINGWSGVSLFYSSLYKRTKNPKWLILSKRSIEKDLITGKFDDYGAYQLEDISRVVPYLDGGSAGVGFVLIELSLLLKDDLWREELEGIYKIAKSKCFYNCGLFRGTAGIIAVSHAIDKYYNRSISTDNLKTLDLHLFKGEMEIYTPGDFGYRLSNDIFSGSLGLFLVIQGIINNTNYMWLPVMNINKVFESNS
ncbi:class III lanthionine synthetase LanKC [Bacillus sp. SN1]|uniref:class III lanthionine synthetase LanKC n=1 Tax=Bacillus sp. SN1 TaxID=2055158 RepID=UPI000C21D79B|nr:class III lanthionine synthetase LanKC [Bacillus sp. SN1]PJH92503.1 serine/threonine protein kinase [Bacillus sp. SN1]PSI04550.1 serine/threonine protein kinase [Bacillus subtilis]